MGSGNLGLSSQVHNLQIVTVKDIIEVFYRVTVTTFNTMAA